MPGDPEECRRRALQCSQMAKRVASRQERLTFLRLRRSWTRMAVEIEDAQAYLATLKATELGDAMDAESLATPRDALDPSTSE